MGLQAPVFVQNSDRHDRCVLFPICSEKDLNSPDSNDSGIQADSQSFQHLSDDLDLYAVVKKTKKKGAKDHHAPEEPAESTEEPLTVALSKEDGIRVAREEEIDDPYTAVEFDSEEKEEDKRVFSLIQKKKKVSGTEEEVNKLYNFADNVC